MSSKALVQVDPRGPARDGHEARGVGAGAGRESGAEGQAGGWRWLGAWRPGGSRRCLVATRGPMPGMLHRLRVPTGSRAEGVELLLVRAWRRWPRVVARRRRWSARSGGWGRAADMSVTPVVPQGSRGLSGPAGLWVPTVVCGRRVALVRKLARVG